MTAALDAQHAAAARLSHECAEPLESQLISRDAVDRANYISNA